MDKLLQKVQKATRPPTRHNRVKGERTKNGSEIKEPDNGSHFIIISGSNKLFIESRLRNIFPPIIPQKIFANHLHASPDKKSLVYGPCQQQNTCNFCSANLCKGSVLDSYITMAGPFDTVYYGKWP
jgi:hypothetical protein